MFRQIFSGVFFLLLLCTTVHGQAFDYLPAPVPGHQVITYPQFTFSYNEIHEQPDWVAYMLTSQEAQIGETFSGNFTEDDSVSTGSAEEDDYRSTGFDKGHLSPAADNKASEDIYQQSYLMSNMSPQLPTFNQGIWKRLEAWVRANAIKYGTVYVVTGPVFKHNLGAIGDNEVTIPGYYYKALLRFEQDGTPRLLGFLMPQVGTVGRIEQYAVPINTIETLTGLDLFPELPDNRENYWESQRPISKWVEF